MTPTFVNHCIKFYKMIDELAYDKELEDKRVVRIFAGSYTMVWKASGIAQTYYSPVKKALEKHGCFEFIQRGSNKVDTVIHLRGLPPDDGWTIDGWKDDTALTKAVADATLRSDVAEIKSSIGGLNIVKAFQEIESRLEALEQAVHKSKKQKA